MRAWTHIADFKQYGKPFSSWLFTIAHHLVIDFYREHSEEVSIEEHSEALQIQLQTKDGVENILTMDELQRAFQSLNEEQREVIQLRFLEGLSAKEAGEVLQKTEGHIRVLQHRALDILRKVMLKVQIHER